MKKRSYKELAILFKETKDERYYTELYHKIRPGLWTYVNKLVVDYDVTQEIVNNTLCTIYFKIEQYDPTYQITTWAYKIAYNEALGHFRHNNKTAPVESLDCSENTDFNIDLNYVDEIKTDEDYLEEDLLLMKQIELTKNAIISLPKLYRPYMFERFLNLRSYDDIYNMMKAKETGISLQTVKNRIFRGKQLITSELKQLNEFKNWK